MDNEKVVMVSPCGVDCEDCIAHLAKENTPERTRLLGAGFKAETLPCPGCRPLQGKCPVIGGSCETYACFEKKGITFCYECSQFPCDKLTPSADKAERALQNLKVFNLCCIQKQGLDAWKAKAKIAKQKYFTGTLIYGKGPILKKDEHE
jgi:hypothetical protein